MRFKSSSTSLLNSSNRSRVLIAASLRSKAGGGAVLVMGTPSISRGSSPTPSWYCARLIAATYQHTSYYRCVASAHEQSPVTGRQGFAPWDVEAPTHLLFWCLMAGGAP